LSSCDVFGREPFFGKLEIAIIVEGGCVLVVDNQILPFRRRCAIRGMDRLEFGVIHTVELRSDGPGPQITDESHGTRMNGRETQELAAPRLGKPFGKLGAAIAEGWFQHIAWTTPGTCIQETGM
jgi:hypothetical protein